MVIGIVPCVASILVRTPRILATRKLGQEHKMSTKIPPTTSLFVCLFVQVFVKIPIAVASTPILFICSTWSFTITRRGETMMIVYVAPSFPLKTLLVRERVERSNSFQNQWEGLQRHLCHWPYYLCNPSVLRKGTSHGKNSLACCFHNMILNSYPGYNRRWERELWN